MTYIYGLKKLGINQVQKIKLNHTFSSYELLFLYSVCEYTKYLNVCIYLPDLNVKRIHKQLLSGILNHQVNKIYIHAKFFILLCLIYLVYTHM